MNEVQEILNSWGAERQIGVIPHLIHKQVLAVQMPDGRVVVFLDVMTKEPGADYRHATNAFLVPPDLLAGSRPKLVGFVVGRMKKAAEEMVKFIETGVGQAMHVNLDEQHEPLLVE
jgi:hypothetical protein